VRIVEADDLAFLQTTIERVAIPLRPSGALPAVGSTVFALCFVSSGELIVRSGFVAGSSSGLFGQTLFGETPFGGNTDSIIVTMNTAPGISGAPVHDTDGPPESAVRNAGRPRYIWPNQRQFPSGRRSARRCRRPCRPTALDPQERPGACYGGSNRAGIPLAIAQGNAPKEPTARRERRALSSSS
jgi:hypothetical protein